MRIHTRTVFQMTADPTKYELLEDESYEYEGPVAECVGGGGSSPPSNTSTSNVPWAGVQHYLTDLYRTASAESDRLRRAAGSIGRADVQETAAQDRLLRESFQPGLAPLAEYGVGTTLGGQYLYGGDRGTEQLTGQQMRDTLRGEYLYGGEGFDAAMEAAAANIMPRVSAPFAGSGTYTGDLRKSAQTKELGRAFAELYGAERANQMEALGLSTQQYGDERQRMIQALGLTPTIDQLRYQPAMVQAGVGEARRAEKERIAAIPSQAMAQEASILHGFLSPSSISTTTGGGMSPLGGAFGGAAVGSMFGPYGALAGSVLGGLLA